MNTDRAGANALAKATMQIQHDHSTLVGICPPALWLEGVGNLLQGSSILLGAQDCIGDRVGAHTGCLNADMASGAGCSMVILGHSERRVRFGETTERLLPAGVAVLDAGMFPIFCDGETWKDRESGRAIEVVSEQLIPLRHAGLDTDKIVVAYEPLWAIGTGLSAGCKDIEEMHGVVREALGRNDAVVLYGGSVSPDSAGDVFSVKGVSGALVGGASLDANKFAAIVVAWEQK